MKYNRYVKLPTLLKYENIRPCLVIIFNDSSKNGCEKLLYDVL